MMRIMRTMILVIALVLVCGPLFAAKYTWTSSDGAYHATDQVSKLPARYREIIRYDTDHYVSPAGYGFERDKDGNFRFFDHASPAKSATRREPPPKLDGPPGSAVTPQQLAEVKMRYQAWGGEPRPEVETGKVKRIISGDTFELENGSKVTYIGIEFPYELKGDTKIHREAVEYQKKLIQGKTVHLIYGLQRRDEMGRELAYVFLGKDMFLNADLVMNGYARVKIVPPNTEYRNLFNRLEKFAKNSMLGIWNAGGN